MRRLVAVMIINLICASAFASTRPFAYTFIAPPRQNAAQAKAIYGPIAKFLTTATGAPITYHYISNWLTYMSEVRANKASLYFDGPALIGWRIARWHDQAAVALKGHLNFVVISKAHGKPISQIKDLVGEPVCAFSPPNLGTLTLDSWFPNPERQPFIMVIHTFADGAQNILSGSCRALLVPLPVYRHMAAKFPGRLRIAYKAPPLPNQGFSISSKVPGPLRRKIIEALLSPAGLRATKPLRDLFGHKPLVAAHNKTYLPEQKLLSAMVGF